jgi:hypothetical protein
METQPAEAPAPPPPDAPAHPISRDGEVQAARSHPGELVAWWMALAASAGLLAWTQWSVPYLPTHDGPEHIVAGTIENHFHDPGTIYAKVFEPASQWAGRGFALVFRPLERWLGWRDATRAAHVISLLLGASAFARLAVGLEPRRRWVALLAFGIAPWSLYMGFFSYTLSMSMGLALVAALVGRKVEGWLPRTAVTAGLLSLAHLHIVPALLTSALVATVLVARRPPAERWPEAARAGAMVAPVFALVPITLQTLGAVPTQLVNDPLYQPLAERLHTLVHLAVPGPTWRGISLLALSCLGVATALRRVGRAEAPRDELGIALGALGFLGLGLIAPLHLPGWQYFGPRLLFPGLLLGLALVPLERLTLRTRLGAAVTLSAAALALAVGTQSLHQRLFEGCYDALAGLDLPLRRTRTSVALSLDSACGVPYAPAWSEVPYLLPHDHMGHLYAAQHGGAFSPMFVGSPAQHAFLPRQMEGDEVVPVERRPSDRALDDPALRQTVLTYFAAHAATLESFLLFGATEADKQLVRSRGFATRFERGGFLMAEFQGCPVTLTIAPAGVAGTLHVNHGMWPVQAAVFERHLPARAEETVRLDLPLIGCGEVWARVVFEGADGAPRICRSSAPNGTLLLRADAKPLSIACELVVPAPRPAR